MNAAAHIGDINPKRSTFCYDLVDIGHQCLSNLFVDMHTMLRLAYDGALATRKSAPWLAVVSSLSSNMTVMIKDLDTLLASNENFLLGLWIAGARASVSSDAAKNLYEFNARTQVTVWSYHESEVLDYATKAWGGLVGDFHLPRWSLFLGKVYNAVKSLQPLNEVEYVQERFALEEAWVNKVQCAGALACIPLIAKAVQWVVCSVFITVIHTVILEGHVCMQNVLVSSSCLFSADIVIPYRSCR